MEIIIKNLELADKKSSSLIELLEKYQVEYSVQPNGSKPFVSGSLPTLEDAWNAGVDEGGSRTGNFEWGIRRKDIEFSEWYAAELEYRSSGQ